MARQRFSRRSFLSSAASFATAAALPAPAYARLATPTGVVLMHGKSGDPMEPNSNISSLAASLRSIGCRVVQPEMPWSKQRYMSVPYELGQGEIGAHVAQLRRNGSAKVIVGGISLGANGALCYAARTGGIDALMLFSLGQWAEYMTVYRKEFVDAATRAQDMIKSGRGDEMTSWHDTNSGRVFTSSATAKVYLSYHDRSGPVAVTPNFTRLDDNLPLLAVMARSDQPDADRTQSLFRARARPATSQFVMLEQGANHFNTPDLARHAAAEWLQRLDTTWKA
jgi:pimeloyl-ACP methyl ester carboxylesterase